MQLMKRGEGVAQAVPLQGALAPVWSALIAVYERVGPVIKRDFFTGFAKDACLRATASSWQLQSARVTVAT